MQTLQEYLAQHYVNRDGLAALARIEPAEVRAVIEAKLAPAPSYVVTAEGKLLSCVFGEFDAQNAMQGEYFHKRAHVWIARAKEAIARVGVQGAHEELRARFKSNFTQALREINDSIVRVPDTFSQSGEVNRARLDARFEEAWQALMDGVYSLCVADPSSERRIAIKEMLQEHLQAIAARVAAGESLRESEKSQVLDLIREYAEAAMPFAPPEYPRSSRKRLVEDLANKLEDPAAATPGR